MKLPDPRKGEGPVSVEVAIAGRRTVRRFAPVPLSVEDVGQLLWACYGESGTVHGRPGHTVPSAGALYPMDVYLLVGEGGVDCGPACLEAGVYHYEPSGHGLSAGRPGDFRKMAAQAALRQHWMEEAPVYFIITAEYGRITRKYGDRGVQYAHMEAGHMAQNVFLQAAALGLGAGIVGAFQDEAVAALGLARGHEPLLILPVGFQR